MKHLLIRLFAGLLLAGTATASLPALSQPVTSTAANNQSSNPLYRGITLTPQQKSKLNSIAQSNENQIKQVLTPAQKKLLAKGAKIPTSTFTKTQKEKIMGIIKANETKARAVFTPEQQNQIMANAKALQGANSQAPAAGQK
jgi:hypothetical protein